MPVQQSHKKAILTETPISVGNPQVNFDAKRFDDFIFEHGYECYIERRIYCPCVSVETGMWLPNCLNCGGTGKVYINKQKSIIGCTSMSNRNKYESWSLTNMGTVNITARPADKMGFEDRVTLTELEMLFSEVINLRTSNDGSSLFAFTKYFPDQVLDAYYFVDVNTPLTYIDSSLYAFQDNRILFDYDTFHPLMPLTITLLYVTHPQYMIIDINRDMVKNASQIQCSTGLPSRQNLPLNYVGKLVHILADQPNLNGLSLYDNTNYNNVPNYDIVTNPAGPNYLSTENDNLIITDNDQNIIT